MIANKGKYDDLCTYVREQSGGTAAVTIVVAGHKGSGFSVQGDMTTMIHLPQLLEHLASDIRRAMEANIQGDPGDGT